MTAKGPNIKIDNDYKLAQYIEKGIKIEEIKEITELTQEEIENI